MTDSNEYVIESTTKKLIDWKELWSYSELFYFFTWRDIKVKYKQAVLGLLWVVLQPLLLMIVLTLFFNGVLKASSEGLPYPVFTLSGLILWTFFSSSIGNAANSMVLNSSIIKKIYFPRLIIPISSILSAAVDFMVAFLLLVLVLLFYRIDIHFARILLFWPAAIMLTFVSAIGFGCGLSALMVKYRDFRFVVGFVLQVGFFVSPIVYSIGEIDSDSLKFLLAVNPMYGAITLFRSPLLSSEIDWALISISIASAVASLLLGLHYFRRTERYFADIA